MSSFIIFGTERTWKKAKGRGSDFNGLRRQRLTIFGCVVWEPILEPGEWCSFRNARATVESGCSMISNKYITSFSAYAFVGDIVRGFLDCWPVDPRLIERACQGMVALGVVLRLGARFLSLEGKQVGHWSRTGSWSWCAITMYAIDMFVSMIQIVVTDMSKSLMPQEGFSTNVWEEILGIPCVGRENEGEQEAGQKNWSKWKGLETGKEG
jgi:hypothetical protein